MATKISVRNLAVAVNKRLILRGVNLEIEANTIVSVIGPAHSGKTTRAFDAARTDSSISQLPSSGEQRLGH